MTSSTIPVSLPKLERSEHWRIWFKELEKYASSLDASKYITEDIEDFLEEPIRPKPSQARFVSIQKRQNNYTSSPTIIDGTDRWSIADDNPAPTAHVRTTTLFAIRESETFRPLVEDVSDPKAWELTPDERKRFENDVTFYRLDLAQYQSEYKKVTSLKTAINASISTHLGEYIEAKHTVKTMVEKLKTLVKPTMITQKLFLKEQWKKALKASAARRKDYDTWTQEVLSVWSAAKSEGFTLEDSEVEESMAFALAAKAYSPNWANQVHLDLVVKRGESRDVETLASEFRDVMRDHIARGGKVGITLSNMNAATLNDQGPDGDKDSRESPQPIKLPPNWTPKESQCICGSRKRHQLEACYNLHASIRPKGWKVRPYTKRVLEAARQHPTYSKFIKESEEKVKASKDHKGVNKVDTDKKEDFTAVNISAETSLQMQNTHHE